MQYITVASPSCYRVPMLGGPSDMIQKIKSRTNLKKYKSCLAVYFHQAQANF